MRIGINLLYLIPGIVGGTQTYAEMLMQSLAEIDKRNTYYLFLNTEAAQLDWPQQPNFHRVVCRFPAGRRELRYAYEQTILPGRLSRLNIDVVHSPGYVSPLYVPCPSIVTICDLNYIALRDAIGRSKQISLGYFVRRSAESCNHIITISDFSKRQIVEELHVVEDKISVIHLGSRKVEASHTIAFEDLQEQYGIRHPYVLAIGSLSPHKNITGLLQAFAIIAPELSHQLVLIGHLPPTADVRVEIREQGLEDRVCITGYVPDEHMLPLLKHANLFVFPSWYEGFGLPILDAQAARVPVVCSSAASIPEVAGAGSLLFDPFSPGEMAAVISQVLRDPETCQRLVHCGDKNLQRFSWAETAAKTLRIYESVVTSAA